MSSVKSELSVDVSIESLSKQSPDGSARSILVNVRLPTPPTLSSFARPIRARSDAEHCPLSTKGTNYAGLGTVAEASSRSSWPTLALHPRGGHGWLSATLSAPFTELVEIEKMPSRGTLGPLTNFKRLGSSGARIVIHPRPLHSRTLIGHLRKPRRSNRMEIPET